MIVSGTWGEMALKALQNKPNTLIEFLHLCIDEICGRRGPSYNDYKSVTTWTEEDYASAVLYVKTFSLKCVHKQWTVKEIMDNLTDLDESCREIFAENLEIRKNDINTVFIEDLCGVSGAYLQDFDWKLKWVMGSSKLSSLREPLLGVTLHLAEKPDSLESSKIFSPPISKTVELELSPQELKTFTEELEKALHKMWQS